MKLVGAGLNDYIDYSTLKITELRRSVVGDHAELLDCVGIGLIGGLVLSSEVVVNAVEQEVIALLAVAVDIGPAVAPAAAAVIQCIGIRSHHARREQRQ